MSVNAKMFGTPLRPSVRVAARTLKLEASLSEVSSPLDLFIFISHPREVLLNTPNTPVSAREIVSCFADRFGLRNYTLAFFLFAVTIPESVQPTSQHGTSTYCR